MYGIDFGTSNTVVTIKENEFAKVLPIGQDGVVPSLMFFAKDQLPIIGHDAVSAYTQALQRKKRHDAAYNSFRFFQAVKLALKNPDFTNTHIFGQSWSAPHLAGLFLKEIKRQADACTGRNETSVVVGRPVVLGKTAAEDMAIQSRFEEACRYAGFESIRFVLEPVGAMMASDHNQNGTILIFDFGGGTLDISIANRHNGVTEILANGGIDLGGYTINEDISRARVIEHFGFYGKFRTMTGSLLDMPSWITDQVASFYALPLAEIARTRATIKDLIPEAVGSDKPKLNGLLEFLDNNLAFSLFDCIDEAKIRLSSDEQSCLRFDVEPFISINEKILRKEFSALLEPRIAAARELIERTMATANLTADQVDHVIRVGGSSRIPAFITMLEEIFPSRVQEGAVFTSIASGLLFADTEPS